MARYGNDDYMPNYVDSMGPPPPAAPFSNMGQRMRSELVGLPGQIGRFGKAAYTGLTHLPYDATGGMLDLAAMAANAALPGDPIYAGTRGDMIKYMADRGLALPEPTGADMPGYLFGGLMAPGALGKAANPAIQALNNLPPFGEAAQSAKRGINQILPRGQTIDIAHYSNAQRPVLDPLQAGTNPGLRGAEGNRDALEAVYAYDRSQPFTKEGALANEVMFGQAKRIINSDDPKYLQIRGEVDLRLKQEAVEQAAGRYAPSVDPRERASALERAIRDAGYGGTRTKTPAGYVVKSFNPIDVTGRGKQVIPGNITKDKLARFIAANPEGVTINPQGVVPTEGIAVARPKRQGGEQVLDNPNVDDIANYLEANEPLPGEFYGSWQDKTNNQFIMDQTRVNPQGARLRSQLQGEAGYQRGLYDIGNKEEIPLMLRPGMEAMAAERATAQQMGLADKFGGRQLGSVGVRSAPPRETPSGLPALLNEDIGALSNVPDVPQASLLRYKPPRGAPASIQKLYEPENVERVKALVQEGEKMGGGSWYNTKPLRDEFVKELGEDAGVKQYEQYMDIVASTSPRSTVEANVRRASYYHNQLAEGNPIDLSGAQPPAPYGHLAHKTQLAVLKPLLESGQIPLDQAKTASFAENLKGNYAPLTADAHYARGIGLQKASGKPETQAPAKTQYEGVEQFGRVIGEDLGMTPAQMQANLWMGAGKETGVANAQIFMSAFNNVLAKTAKARGSTQEQTLKDFITGKLPFLTVAGATVTGEMLRSAPEQQQAPGGLLM